VTATLHRAEVVVTTADARGPSASELGTDVPGVIRGGAVLIVDGLVADVGPATEVARRAGRGVRERRHRGVLTPGLVNAHAHLQYTAYADLAVAGLPFSPWISEMVRRRAVTTDEQWAESARAGAHLAIRSGTTAVADIVTDAPALLPLARSGLRGISYVEALGADDTLWDDARRHEVAGIVDAAPVGRSVGVSPHSLYTLSRRAFAESIELARHRGQRVHTHLAESADEVEFVALGTGLLADLAAGAGWSMDVVACGGAAHTPAVEMDALGGLGPDVHVAHGVHCDRDDRALLRERGTAVALCVRSNRVLKAGRPPVADYLDEGSPIALGTDSLASSPSLDLLEEARAARDLARAQGYAAADLERRLMAAATTGGAFAMGLDGRTLADGPAADVIGVLRPGALGDLAVFDVPVERWDAASYDVFRALIDHGAGRCVATAIGGTLLHRR
jgi:cytosine/adenosine deaminase-related metal-dependent hydrolase